MPRLKRVGKFLHKDIYKSVVPPTMRLVLDMSLPTDISNKTDLKTVGELLLSEGSLI